MDNRLFWNHRYATLPQLGSGVSSRGYAAAYKTGVIRATLAKHNARSILDIGCGDCCWLDESITSRCAYLGCDIAETVIERNAKSWASNSQARFFVHDIASTPLMMTADLVVCFDVLIHQVQRAAFDVALSNILMAIGKVGLISYRSPTNRDRTTSIASIPANDSPEAKELERDFAKVFAALPPDRPRGETAFHGPLPEIIALHPDLIATSVGGYREHTVYEVEPRRAGDACARRASEIE